MLFALAFYSGKTPPALHTGEVRFCERFSADFGSYPDPRVCFPSRSFQGKPDGQGFQRKKLQKQLKTLRPMMPSFFGLVLGPVAENSRKSKTQKRIAILTVQPVLVKHCLGLLGWGTIGLEYFRHQGRPLELHLEIGHVLFAEPLFRCPWACFISRARHWVNCALRADARPSQCHQEAYPWSSTPIVCEWLIQFGR